MRDMQIRANDVDRLKLYRPAGVSASAPLPLVLVCPGGGYGRLADHEGEPVALWANRCGFAAAVLTYRVAPEATFPNALNDALDAVRTLRKRKEELGLTGKIAVLGFSAGGHLAASLAVHGCQDAETRVDGSVLIYPVITMREPLTHTGSRVNLLGNKPPPPLVEKTSNEQQVTERTPPAFLIHGMNDVAVPVDNSLLYANALQSEEVSFELHIFPDGPHGFGMGVPGTPVAQWPTLAGVWLRGIFGA